LAAPAAVSVTRHAPVVRVRGALDQAVAFGPVDESNCAVGLGLVLVPTQKAPQAGAEFEQMLVVGLSKRHIVWRYRARIACEGRIYGAAALSPASFATHIAARGRPR
jgi:hypothetical protein